MIIGNILTLDGMAQLMKLHNTMVLNGAVFIGIHAKIAKAEQSVSLAEICYAVGIMHAIHLGAIRKFIEEHNHKKIIEEVNIPIENFLPDKKDILYYDELLPVLKFIDSSEVLIETERAKKLLHEARKMRNHFVGW
jgi:hypothetical protein